MKFIIVARDYNENGGGVIALHKLCHILNKKGHEAYVMPFRTEFEFGVYNFLRYVKNLMRVYFFKYKTNDNFKTPVLRFIYPWQKNNFVVIYPENVSGNPLKVTKVVRWFLYHPGYFSKKINYGTGELYFSYGTFGNSLDIFGSKKSDHQLKITHFFDEYYNLENIAVERQGTAYCLRKEKGREIIHDLNDSICIDGLSHKEISEIFKRVKTFISYDLYTAYSWFAVLCGCESIVVPKNNMSIEQWHGNDLNRTGIAYGFDTNELLADEKEKARQYIKSLEKQSGVNVDLLIYEIQSFFHN